MKRLLVIVLGQYSFKVYIIYPSVGIKSTVRKFVYDTKLRSDGFPRGHRGLTERTGQT